MTDDVRVCPDCDSSTIYRRTTKPPSERWRCKQCGGVFPDTIRRAPKTTDTTDRNLDPKVGLARDLMKMDAADLGDDPRPPEP